MTRLRQLRGFVRRFDAGEELAEGVDGGRSGRPLIELAFELAQERDLLAQQDVVLALEVGEDRSRGDVRGVGDLRQGGVVVAALGEQLERDPGDLLAGLLLLALAQPELPGGRIERAH